MQHIFYPREYLDSTYDIDFEQFYQQGFRGIIFDIDNTLVTHGAHADKRAQELFQRLRAIGFKTYLVSNNKEPRVKSFCEEVGADGYVYKAGKPSGKGYRKAMEEMGLDRSRTLSVGDQLFTDMWGTNLAGLYSVLVKPIDPREEIQIVLKRFLEKPVIWAYLHSKERKDNVHEKH
ncbi:MAG: YqeG family HAD IIIA-type phosphatase [Lachnospiraceae bacterium]|nr:YqeG family HAD IIIA-type phosphatase [Lachnospiraceae bacterium]